MEQKTSTAIVIWSSWVLLIVSIVAWPLTARTIFADEPQGILGLSWFAIIYAAANTLLTAYTKRSAEDSPTPTSPDAGPPTPTPPAPQGGRSGWPFR